MKIVITGYKGFVGTYLKNFYKQEDLYLFDKENINLLDYSLTKERLEKIKPNVVFHLASQSSPAISWKDPWSTFNNNIIPTINLLNLAKMLSFKLVIASSAEVYDYKNVSNENPLNEFSNLRPRNPYGISKLTVDLFASMIASDQKINVSILRLFNHIGPGQSDKFVVSAFAKQLAKIKLGLQEPIIHVGNLEAKRDLLSVKDAIKAYDLVSKVEQCGEVYNVCSGKSYKIEDILNKLIDISGLDVKVVQDPDRMRPSDIPIFVGDYSKIKNHIGWEPSIPLEKTLKDTYFYWISELEGGIL